MVVTHLFQILAFVAMEPPTALAPVAITEEKNKVFRTAAADRPGAGGPRPVRGLPTRSRASRPDSQTETFVALEAWVDNWRWSGVPFYLRTGKAMAENARIISIAFREPPQSMFPAGSGVGKYGPDHLTFDLDESSRLSLSFYGKQPGPSLNLEKVSMQFSLHEVHSEDDTLEAYERLIRDAMNGDHTLFTTAEGIERLWEISTPLLEHPPEVLPYAPGHLGPGRDPRADRPPQVAPPFRAPLARPQADRGDRAGLSSTGPRTRSDAGRRREARSAPPRSCAPPASDSCGGP